MSRPLHLLFLSASQRSGSLNLQLAAVAATHARATGAQVTPFDLRALAGAPEPQKKPWA